MTQIESYDTPGAGILFRAAVYGGSGYADGNLAVLEGVTGAGWPLQLAPLGAASDRQGLLPVAARRRLAGLQRARVDLARSVLYQSAPAVEFDTHLEARVRVGRSAWETDCLPPSWAERCNAQDEIWVPSRFNRESFAAAGVAEAKLRVLPEGLNTGRYRPGLQPLPIPGRRRFNFLSVFDWIDRKGPDVLLRAWARAFRADDDVALILKVYKFDDVEAPLEERLLHLLERELGAKLEDLAPILLLRGLLPAEAMPRLYASAEAFVLPSRGEGWGRPYMEAAASGLAVIAPRWGGQLDYLHDGNSFLIDLENVRPVPASSDREIYMGQRWAEPSAEHLAQLMRALAARPEAARARGAVARREMAERWDTQVLAPRWQGEFARLLA